MNEKITLLLRKKYALFMEKSNEARMAMAQLQAVAEAAELTASEVNQILGVELFQEKQDDRAILDK